MIQDNIRSWPVVYPQNTELLLRSLIRTKDRLKLRRQQRSMQVLSGLGRNQNELKPHSEAGVSPASHHFCSFQYQNISFLQSAIQKWAEKLLAYKSSFLTCLLTHQGKMECLWKKGVQWFQFQHHVTVTGLKENINLIAIRMFKKGI